MLMSSEEMKVMENLIDFISVEDKGCQIVA
jgi:hypothetical protein